MQLKICLSLWPFGAMVARTPPTVLYRQGKAAGSSPATVDSKLFDLFLSFLVLLLIQSTVENKFS